MSASARSGQATASAADLTGGRDWLAARAAAVRPWLWLATGAGLAAAIFTIVQAGLFAHIVASAVQRGAIPPDASTLLPLFALLAAAIALRAGCQWLQEVGGHEAGHRVRRQTRSELLDHVARLGPARLSERHSAELAGQLLEHTEALHGYYARFLPQLVLAAAIPLLILAVILPLDWLAALFLLGAAPLIPAFMVLVGIGAERLNQRQFTSMARLSAYFLDRIRGLGTLQLFGHGEQSITEVAHATDDYRIRSLRVLRVAFLSSAVLEFFAAVAIAAVAIYIGFGLLGYIEFGPAPQLTLFSGLFILLLAPEFFQPLRQLAQHYHDRAAAIGASEALIDLLARPAPPPDTATGNKDAGPGAAICLERVCVEQPGRGRLLGPLSLTITAGTRLVIEGASGAGKTTLLRLLAGFHDASSGHIQRNARPGFAWLDQKPFLVQGSIAENLRLAAPEATDARLEQALDEVGLGDWRNALPRGLATPITEQGAGLSGGQAQRLALARVFLSPAPLVLLDEPTAHLDRHSESLVIEALTRLADQGRTLVIASHHPAIRQLADRIITLRHGQLAGHGPNA